MSASDRVRPEHGRQIVEIWGDVVDERGARVAVVLGIVIAVPAYLLAQAAFAGAVGNPDLARTYAMVIGLAACLLAGGIVARLYAPQRIVATAGGSPGDQRRVLDELAAAHGLGSLDALTPPEREELRRQGLEQLFLDAEADAAARTGSDDRRRDGSVASGGDR